AGRSREYFRERRTGSQGRRKSAFTARECRRNGLGQHRFRHLSQARLTLVRKDQAGEVHDGSRRREGGLPRGEKERVTRISGRKAETEKFLLGKSAGSFFDAARLSFLV